MMTPNSTHRTLRRSRQGSSDCSIDQLRPGDVAPNRKTNDNPQPSDPNIRLIEKFLATPSQPAVKAADHTTSTGTRAPAFFDMHLDRLQILRHIELSEDLIPRLGKLAEEYCTKGSPIPSRVIDPDLSRNLQRYMGNEVRNEAGLVEHYEKKTGYKCACIASYLLGGGMILGLHPRPSAKQPCAIADLFLRLNIDSIEASSSPLKAELLLAARTFPELSVSEFKSLMFETEEFLDHLRLVASEGTFPWTRCDECSKHHYQDGYQKRTFAPMGFDADSTNTPFPYPMPQQCTKDKKREQGLEAVDEPEEEAHEASQEDEETRLHAYWIFQQAWAEAVIHDATFLVIRCGNYEIIGLRNRAHQTLHISGINHLAAAKSPTYAQLHVGLALGVVLDAIGRASRLAKADKVPRTWRKDWGQRKEVKGIVPRPAELLALGREALSVVLHPPVPLVTRAKNPMFLRMGAKPGDYSNEPVAQITNIRQVNNSDRTFRAVLHVKGHRIPTDIYLKLAVSPRSRLHLEKEHAAYQTLARRGISGIPDVIGLFVYTEVDDFVVLALITLDAGMPMSPNDCALPISFTAVLQQIHDAGYLHGAIHQDHLLVDNQRTTMISLANAAPYDRHCEAVEEMQDLQRVSCQDIKRRRIHDDAPYDRKRLVTVVGGCVWVR
ncbi:hypothetical protein AB1N83_009779 [Pleurotus pulmonarius]